MKRLTEADEALGRDWPTGFEMGRHSRHEAIHRTGHLVPTLIAEIDALRSDLKAAESVIEAARRLRCPEIARGALALADENERLRGLLLQEVRPVLKRLFLPGHAQPCICVACACERLLQDSRWPK